MKSWLAGYLTVTEAAEQFAVGNSTLRHHVRAGTVRSRMYRGHYFLLEHEVARWNRKRTENGRRFSPNWGKVYRLRMLDRNDQQIADDLGISRERVRVIRKGLALRPVRGHRT